MPNLTLVTGNLEQIEDALADAVARSRTGDPLAPATVVIGHVLLRPYLRRTLARRGVAHINVRFLRPHELAQELFRGTATDAQRTRLTPGVERLLVREVAESATDGYFAAIAGRDGFADALGRVFRELELGGFTPETLASATAQAHDATQRGGKLRQIAELYAEYRRRGAGFAGVTDDYAAATAGATIEGPVFVYGLWDPAKLPAQLIERVAAQTDVSVFLSQHGDRAVDDAHAAFRDRLVAGGAASRAAAASNGAGTLTSSLFSTPTGAVADGRVSLVSAPDTVREVWEAARTCLEWARQGIRFHEMAIVYRNRDPYRALVDEIFQEARIETYLHDGRLLSAHPLGRRLLSLLELAAGHETFERAKVMEFLTETVLPKETRDMYDRVNPSEWETYTRDAGVIVGIEQWRTRLRRLADEKRLQSTDERFEWLADVADRIGVLLQFAEDLHAALAERAEEATWDEHLEFVRGLCERYAAGTEPLLKVLEDLKLLTAVRPRVTFDVFCRAVRDDFDGRDTTRVLDEPVRLFGRRGVAVLDASSLRHMRFRAVYMLGVAERAWPPPSRPDPLLLEHERRAINATGGGLLPLRTEPDSEALTFWLATQAAHDKLAVSYARADAGRSGKHLPSYFFRSIVDQLEGRRVPIAEIEGSPFVRRVAAGRLASDELADSLSEAEYDRGLMRRANDGTARAAIDALSAESPAFGRAVRARRERWAATLSPFDGVMTTAAGVEAAAVRSPFVNGEPVSASRLEMYATCPYRYFLRYTLGINPIEEPAALDRIDHLQRGSLIHDILQRFLSHIGRGDPPRRERREAHLEILREVTRGACDEREQAGLTGRPLIWQMDKQVIAEDLARWYDMECAEDDLIPGAFETRFGPARPGMGEEDADLSRDEPLAIEIEGRTVLVQGRIDRIDWDEARSHFRVIDYKTGRNNSKKDAVLNRGRSLQMPIYVRAAARALELERSQGSAEYFYNTQRGGFSRHAMSSATLEASSADFERILTTTADGVDGGYFAPNPEKGKENCKWCDFKDVCDAGIDRVMRLKEGDARGASFIALGEIE